MPRYSLPLLGALAMTLAGCGSNSSTSPNDPSTSAARVDTAVIGTWVGIPGTSSASDSVRITKDSLISTWTYGDGSTSHAWSLYPVALSGAWFYAKPGQGGKAGRMGTSNGQTVRDNVTYEYILSQDTLYLELQSSDQYDTLVDRTSSLTHALLRQN